MNSTSILQLLVDAKTTLFTVVCFLLIVLGCSQPVDIQPEPTSVADDIRATVVAEITATSVATHRGSPLSSTAVRLLPTPSPTSIPSPTATPTLSFIVEDISSSVVQVVTPLGTGSGFVVDSDGLVLTNAHVVEDFSTVEVRGSDGRSHLGNVRGIDEVADLALIELPVKDLNPVTLGDSEGFMVGEDVISMGFPTGDMLGASPTITRGIVSAKRKSDITLIQTDAAINPGNSGGPLFLRNGQVIGINTSKLFQLEGIGLAISINDARERLDRLARGESVLLSAATPFGKQELSDRLNSVSQRPLDELISDASAEWSNSVFGFEHRFNEPVLYLTRGSRPQLVVVYTRELNYIERLGFEHYLSEHGGLINEIINRFSGSPNVSITNISPLILNRAIGDKSASVWLDVSLSLGFRDLRGRIFNSFRPYDYTRIEVVMFLQDSNLVFVETYYNSRDTRFLPIDHIAMELESAILLGPVEEASQIHATPPANLTAEGYHAVVLLDVIDGDTIDVLSLSGIRKGGERHRVQLYGIDAPELGTPAGEEAFNHLRHILPESLQIRPIDVDECGRFVVDVLPRVAEQDTLTFSERQVRNGTAVAGKDDYCH